MARDGRIQNRIAWWVIGLVALADMIWILGSAYEVSFSGIFQPLLGSVVVGPLLLFYTTIRPDERIASALTGVLILIVFTAAGAILSYLLAGLAFPFWDGALHRWDLALGLDWRAYLAWTNDHPTIGLVFKLAYQSLMPQMIIMCVVLGLTGRRFELSVFTLAFVLSGVLCVLISAVMPAMAMYVHLGLKPADFANLSPTAAYVHVEHMLALRGGTYRTLDLDAAQGIVTFPSYHACLAVIFLRGLWSIPLLRWPGAILNLAVIAATPIDGGHYFVDVGAGIALAIGCLVIAQAPERLLLLGRGIQALAVRLPRRRSRNWAT